MSKSSDASESADNSEIPLSFGQPTEGVIEDAQTKFAIELEGAAVPDEAPDLPEETRGTSPFAGHPQGLSTLFFTEMWERFSYYGMRAILALYMVAPVTEGGLGFSTEKTGEIYGTYTMLVYMMSIPGGFIADRFLGARLSVLVGGIIIAVGHFTLAFKEIWFFYGGLILIVLGTGLLKPNISSMLGLMYKQGDIRRDAGFSIFYMGINIGAALAPIVCGFLAQGKEFRGMLKSWGLNPETSWHWGFAAAGVGMTFGLIHYWIQRKPLQKVGSRRHKPRQDATDKQQAAPNEPLTKEEWKRLGAIAILFFFTMMFWAVYEQGGTSLNLFADKLVDNKIFGWEYPSSWLQSLQAVYVIAFAPLLSMLWIKLGDKQPSAPAKFSFGLFLLGLGIVLMVPASMLAAQGKISPLWLVVVYLLEVLGELCLSPVGLSTVTKLAPVRFVGITMGVWFLAASMGNKIAGHLGGMFKADDTQILVTLFGSMAGAVFLATLVLALLVPTVKKLMSGIK